MDLEEYLWEGQRHLSDTRYSKQTKKKHLHENFHLSPKSSKKYMRKNINAKQLNCLIDYSERRPRRFYLPPKIHQDPANWSKPFEIPPGRPIDCSSEKYRSAEFIDYYLNPLARTDKSYIKGTCDFIDSSILFTMDVDGLYTNTDI